MKFAILLVAALGSASAAAAETISAQRYIDAQGVEVIQNRNLTVAVGAVKQVASTTERAPSGKLATMAPGLHDASFQVSSAQQATRDQERVRILEQELDNEMRALAETSRLSAALTVTTHGAPESARVKERMNDHQKNIAALQAELRHTRQGR